MKRNHWLGRAFGRVLPSENRLIHRQSQYVELKLEALEDRVVLDDASTHAVTGIHSRNLLAPGGLILSGAGVSIGQVETGRPGKPDFDTLANSHPDVIPREVFHRNVGAEANDYTSGGHGTKVAGVMIANGAANSGVANAASLYASARGQVFTLDQAYGFYVICMQHIALQDLGRVRATNLSFSVEGTLDGNSRLTQGVDWSARVHDVLYAKSRGNLPAQPGDDDGEEAGKIVPSDNFNAIKVAATKKDGQGVFRIVWEGSDFTSATDGRRLTDIVAPGADILVPPIEGDPYLLDSGTSYAARVDAHGQNTEIHARPVENIRALRPTQVLFALRAGCLRGVSGAAAADRRPDRDAQGSGPRAGARNLGA